MGLAYRCVTFKEDQQEGLLYKIHLYMVERLKVRYLPITKLNGKIYTIARLSNQPVN